MSRPNYFKAVAVSGGQRCTAENSSLMTCTMPVVRLPSDFQFGDEVNQHMSVAARGGAESLTGGPDDRDRADIYVGLLFDGYRHYANLTEVMPRTRFQFFGLPTFYSLTDIIVYRPQSFSDIDIRVSTSLFEVISTC